MDPKDTPQTRRPARLIRILRMRPRLFISAAIGLLVIALLPGEWRMARRVLIGWDVGVLLYLALAYQMMARSDVARIRRRAANQDEGQVVMLALTVAAAVASLGAIVAELAAHSGSAREPLQITLASGTIVLSWIFIHTIFALHYAHEYYAERNGGGGLAFSGNERADYWDFVYFSLVIGMTSQVSDVAVTARSLRRLVAAHGLVAFGFNTSLLALAVNIAAGAI